jgi:hypothetical protein
LPTGPRAADLAVAEGTGVAGRREELDSATRLRLDPPEVLALAADYETYKAGLYLDDLGVVVATSQGRSLASATGAARRKAAAGTATVGRVRTFASIITTRLTSTTIITSFIAIGVDVVTVGITA